MKNNTPFAGRCIEQPDRAVYFLPIPFWRVMLGQKKDVLAEQEKTYQIAFGEWKGALKKWEGDRDSYENKRSALNARVDALKASYEDKNQEVIEEYCGLVLNNSEYPDSFSKDFDLQYNPENGMVLVDYGLPRLADIPKLNIVKYVKSRDVLEEKYISQAAHEKLFDSAVYQIALRTIHELFEADVVDAISTINFNGVVTDINPATGHTESSCIISLQAEKEQFIGINLANVNPKQCFRNLKGVGSSKLSAMAAVRPILELDKADRRFTQHYEVADGIDGSFNLAAMDWEDFEHLIREIFEKEFAQNGGEVKVTQASSDGGVDAIAFDPDPIRGGKIVIQAKRYTNTVGVSAVRDLYGTVMSEGATKGVLVTTADYGPDSYAFAKGKPLTLMNGSNLLHLLEKHGHRAKIDIKEAKRILKENL
ncbi:MAG: restriction endonuclease [Candidatus Hydrogenedentes bacterium]|nr:restriction endonuclease [Candidatus Hydrogenedentota bacterium]